MLRCINNGVTTIKLGHQTTGNVRVIWSDESFKLFPTSGRVCIWRTLKEAYSAECLVPTVKHRGASVMVWAEISQYSPIITFHGQISAKEYVDRLGNQVHPVIRRYFRTTMQFSKMTGPPFTQLELFSDSWKSMKVTFNIFPGQHNHQI
jgi:hypothetical protein